MLSKQPFFGVLLMNFRMALDKTTSTSYTDGTRLSFNPDFLKSLSDTELELVMMHEVLHAALGHPFRVQADYEIDLYDLACDIVVNSNILQCLGGDVKRITIKQFGILPHKTPSGKEGYECTVEEVYDELMKASGRIKKKKRGAGQGSGKGSKSNSTPDSDKSDNDELDNSDEDDSSNDETDNDSDDDASDDEKSDSEEKEDEENEDGEEKEGEENDSDAAGAGGKGKGKSKKDRKGKGASLKSGNKGKSSKQKNNGSASGGTGVSDEEKTFNKPSLEELDFNKTDVLNNYFAYELLIDDEIVSQGTVIFTAPKHFNFKNPDLSYEIVGDEVVIMAKSYAKSVELSSPDSDPVFSDNYFDMEVGEKRIKILEGRPKEIRVRSVYDIR